MNKIFALVLLLAAGNVFSSTSLVLDPVDSEKLCMRLGGGEGYSTRDRIFNIFCDHDNGKYIATVFYDTERTSPTTPITISPNGRSVVAKITDIHEAKIMLDSVGERYAVKGLSIVCKLLPSSQYADYCLVEATF